jgi:hypothetical protein
MVPHAKAIRHYLSHLRNNSQIENGSLQNIGLAPTGQRSRPANGSLPIQSSPDRTALAQCENVIRDYKCAVSTRIARSLRLASVASSLLARDVARAPSFFFGFCSTRSSAWPRPCCLIVDAGTPWHMQARLHGHMTGRTLFGDGKWL